MWACQVGSHRLVWVLILLEGVGWESGDEHTPCASSAGLGILPPAIPQGAENMLHKNLFMLVDCVTKEKYQVFEDTVTMIYTDSY